MNIIVNNHIIKLTLKQVKCMLLHKQLCLWCSNWVCNKDSKDYHNACLCCFILNTTISNNNLLFTWIRIEYIGNGNYKMITNKYNYINDELYRPNKYYIRYYRFSGYKFGIINVNNNYCLVDSNYALPELKRTYSGLVIVSVRSEQLCFKNDNELLYKQDLFYNYTTLFVRQLKQIKYVDIIHEYLNRVD